MKIAQLPANEHERLKALHEYYILDTLPETDFDDITRIATELCHTPISLVSIIDSHRQWFKSRHGLITPEISRDFAFCSHAINTPHEVFIVEDLTKDDRFHDNPLVAGEPHVVFYAGIPLVNPDGFALGTLCVWDNIPRVLEEKQIYSLKSLARQIVSQLELRKKIIQLKQKQSALKIAYDDLEKFSYIASHDLKSPLNNIISLTHFIKDEYHDKLDKDGVEYINYLHDAAHQLSDLVSCILNYSKSSQLLVENKEYIDVNELLEEVKGLLPIPVNTYITHEKCKNEVYTSRIALKQILLNLVQNAIKYNDKPQIHIQIIMGEDRHNYTFEVRDNGPGIADENKEKIFELFERLKRKDAEGMGMGLAIVKRLAEKLGGAIKVQSRLGQGTSFLFTVPK